MSSLFQPGSRIRSALVTLTTLAIVAVPIGILAFDGFRYLNFLFWAAIGILVWSLYAARSGYDPRSESYDHSVKKGSRLWTSIGPRMRFDFMAFQVLLTLSGILLLAAAVMPFWVAGTTSFIGAAAGAILYSGIRS
jgi:hypothetical protein